MDDETAFFGALFENRLLSKEDTEAQEHLARLFRGETLPLQSFYLDIPSAALDFYKERQQVKLGVLHQVVELQRKSGSEKGGKLCFEITLNNAALFELRNSRYIGRHYDLAPYGSVFKAHRNLLALDTYFKDSVQKLTNKEPVHEAFPITLAKFDPTRFGVIKKEFVEPCSASQLSNEAGLSADELKNLKTKEAEFANKDSVNEAKTELRNEIERKVYELRGKGKDDKRVREIEALVIGNKNISQEKLISLKEELDKIE